MKRLSSFLLPPILSLTLTLSPVMAQSPSAPKSDTAAADGQETAATPQSSQELDQKNTDKQTPALAALPSQDSSTPPGKTSKALVVVLIVAGAAAIAAIILAFHHGGGTTGTVLAPGTPTVAPPGS
jgi:hypothetical protein